MLVFLFAWGFWLRSLWICSGFFSPYRVQYKKPLEMSDFVWRFFFLIM